MTFAARPVPYRPIASWRLVSLALLAALGLAPGAAAEGFAENLASRVRCKTNYGSFGEFARSQASVDLYHGLAFFGAGAVTSLAGSPSRRWSSRNDFDTGIRSGLRLGNLSARRSADTASDALLAFSMAVLPASGILAQHLREQDCTKTWDMATDTIESLGLTLFITNVIKTVAGRERPFGRSCNSAALLDSDCSSEDRQLSFISGHSSIAAAGAGLSCAFAFKREAWGSSAAAKWGPCATGALASVATGLLRVGADRHWTSDILGGFAVGAVVGWLDTWGPLDLLKFHVRNEKGKTAARGMLLPHADRGAFGAQLVMSF